MKATCEEACNLQGKANYLRKMIGDSCPSVCGPIGECINTCGEFFKSESITKIEKLFEMKNLIVNCIPPGNSSKFPGSEWTQCECIIYAKVEGGSDKVRSTIDETNKEECVKGKSY